MWAVWLVVALLVLSFIARNAAHVRWGSASPLSPGLGLLSSGTRTRSRSTSLFAEPLSACGSFWRWRPGWSQCTARAAARPSSLSARVLVWTCVCRDRGGGQSAARSVVPPPVLNMGQRDVVGGMRRPRERCRPRRSRCIRGLAVPSSPHPRRTTAAVSHCEVLPRRETNRRIGACDAARVKGL
jgi:hypothetical protein